MNTPAKKAQRFIDRLKTKTGAGGDKKQLYWQHEAQKTKEAIDAYRSKRQEPTSTMENNLQKKNIAIQEISSELIARYKDKAKQSADELESQKKFGKALRRRTGILSAVSRQVGRAGEKLGQIAKSYNEENTTSAPPFEMGKKSAGTVTDKSGAVHTASSRVRHLARLAIKMQSKKKEQSSKPVNEISAAAHAQYRDAARGSVKSLEPHVSGEYGDIAKNIIKRRMKGIAKSAGLELRKKLTQEEVHPDALHVQPVTVNGKQKYKVHAVGKNFADGIKVGEHLSDTELDDFHEMGGKIKHIKEDTMKSLKAIMEEMKRGRGRPRKNPQPETSSSEDEHEYGPSSRPASREGSSSHIIQQLHSAAHDDLPKKGRDVDFKHHTGFVPAHVARKAIENYAGLKKSEDKANWAADHFEMHHKDFMKKYS